MHVAIAGNIGSGKTTLTKMLAAHYGWTPKFEPVDFNPYLADYYEDMERWSFNLQISFLNDYENYTDLFDLMMSLVGLPDLLIYLRSSIPNLIAQIQKRGREYEKSIRIDYLTGLNEKYEDWISTYKGNLLIVDADNIKFGNKPEDFELITNMIDAKLYGLFPEK